MNNPPQDNKMAGDFSPATNHYPLITNHYLLIFSPIDLAWVNSSR